MEDLSGAKVTCKYFQLCFHHHGTEIIRKLIPTLKIFAFKVVFVRRMISLKGREIGTI